METTHIAIIVLLVIAGVWYWLGCPGAMPLLSIFISILDICEKVISTSEDTNSKPVARFAAKLLLGVIGCIVGLLIIFRRSLPRFF